MKQKMLVLWDHDLGLTNTGYRQSAITMVRLYRKVAVATKRILVLCMTTSINISGQILALFDQVFIMGKNKSQCVKNRHGYLDDVRPPNMLWHSGRINSLRQVILMMLFASDHDRNSKTGLQ